MAPKTKMVPIRAAKARDVARDRWAERVGLDGKTRYGVPVVRPGGLPGRIARRNGRRNGHPKINTFAAPLQAPMADLALMRVDDATGTTMETFRRRTQGQRIHATKSHWKRSDRRAKARAAKRARRVTRSHA